MKRLYSGQKLGLYVKFVQKWKINIAIIGYLLRSGVFELLTWTKFQKLF